MPTPFNSKYSSTEIENFFDLLNSNSFITNTVSNLINYYLKSDTYSKSEVDSIINTVKNGRFQKVNSLPEEDIDTNVIYLVQKQDTENNNIKDEYINLDGTSTGWEKIGSTEINLDGYVTIQALNTALSNYVQSSNIVTILANRTSFSSVENMVATPAADLYDGCLAYVTATKKNYQYDSSNTVDPDTGKWREFSSGGGGGTDYTAGDGIDITDDTISIDPMPAEDMGDVIDELPTGGNIAVTGYVPLGTLIPFYGETAPKFFLACDGTAYNKADYPELAKHLLSLTDNAPYVVDGDDTKFKVPDLRGEFIRGTGTNSHTNQGSGANVGVHQDATSIPSYGVNSSGELMAVPYSNTDNYVLNQDGAYNSGTSLNKARTATMKTAWDVSGMRNRDNVRPTNTSVLFCIAYKDIYSNPMNDYSTDEKVVGTWIDGKTLYQKTFVDTLPNLATDFEVARKEISVSSLNVDTMVSMGGMFDNGIIYIDIGIGIGVISANLTTGVSSVWFNKGDEQIYLEHNRTPWSNRNCIITIQYTKTTD